MFRDHLERWKLVPDGEVVTTSTSQLLPVLAGGKPALLKVTTLREEKRGGALMEWWDGDGAARVLARRGGAVLLERAEGGRTLAQLVRGGRDDEASRVLCAVAARLHTPRTTPAPSLTPLARWFQPLATMARVQGGVLRVAATVADELLATPSDAVVLHGDLHHANVLDFGPRGWLAIDPKGLVGERAFDYANLFCNPDHATALRPGRLRRQLDVVATETGLPRDRLLAWVLAWAGLSAAFQWEDGLPAQGALAFAEAVAREFTARDRPA